MYLFRMAARTQFISGQIIHLTNRGRIVANGGRHGEWKWIFCIGGRGRRESALDGVIIFERHLPQPPLVWQFDNMINVIDCFIFIGILSKVVLLFSSFTKLYYLNSL